MSTYTVIPDLVSVETDFSKIPDFPLGESLDYYSPRRQQYHYKIKVTSRITIPENCEFVNGTTRMDGDTVYYERRIFPGLSFKLSYNMREKLFLFHPIYLFHFFGIGGIFTMGRYIFHMIEYDLLKDDLFVLLSSTIKKGDQTISVLSPYGNGKTTFIYNSLKSNFFYISENFTIFDLKNNFVYGTAPIFRNGKGINKKLKEIISKKKALILNKALIGAIYLVLPKMFSAKKRVLVDNYIHAFTGYYKKNNFMRTILFYQLLHHTYAEKLEAFAKELTDKTDIISSFDTL